MRAILAMLGRGAAAADGHGGGRMTEALNPGLCCGGLRAGRVWPCWPCWRGAACHAPGRSTRSGAAGDEPAGPKHQRMVLIVVALVALIGAGLLATWALRNQASYFYLPADIVAHRPRLTPPCGWAEWSSAARSANAADGVTVQFVVGRRQGPGAGALFGDPPGAVRRRVGRGGRRAYGRRWHFRCRQSARQSMMRNMCRAK